MGNGRLMVTSDLQQFLVLGNLSVTTVTKALSSKQGICKSHVSLFTSRGSVLGLCQKTRSVHSDSL